ncbi:hypothetical protein ACQ4PT_006144 [Festuca glaucescens]
MDALPPPPPRPKPRPSATTQSSAHTATAGQPAGVRVGKMQKTKSKGRGKNIAHLNKKQNASRAALQQCASEDRFGNLVKARGDISSNLTKQIVSELSETIVSLASFNGDAVVSECTGIFIENLCADTTTIRTSANLVGSLYTGITDNLTIKVRLPSDRVVIGILDQYNFNYDLAVVKIKRARGFQEAHLSSSQHVQFESSSEVVAVGRCFNSGMLKFINGTVFGPASHGLRQLVLPTSIINMALSGCPLVDFDGNFVGVSMRRCNRTVFVRMTKILEFLQYSGTTRHAADANDKRDSNRHSAADTNDKRGSKRHIAADTNDKRGSNSDIWTQHYKSIYEDFGLDFDLFKPGEAVFYRTEVGMRVL